MIFILEALNYYDDIWSITFYFLVALALLLGLLWTYYQVIIKGGKKKEPLKENVIYNHSDDVIENYDIEPKKKESSLPKNNYVIRDYKDEIEKETTIIQQNFEENNLLEEESRYNSNKQEENKYSNSSTKSINKTDNKNYKTNNKNKNKNNKDNNKYKNNYKKKSSKK